MNAPEPPSDRPLSVLILAAGLGKRMHSQLPKVLHHLAGKPLVAHVLDAARALNPTQMVVVIGHQAEKVQTELAGLGYHECHWVVQNPPLGTGHAVATALTHLRDTTGDLLILNGDTPLIAPETLSTLVAAHRAQDRLLTFLTTRIDPPHGYGRVLRDDAGHPVAIVEEKDATDPERLITEINTGVYCVAIAALGGWLEGLAPDNRQGEYYLTGILPAALASAGGQRWRVVADGQADPLPWSGVNTRAQLADLEAVVRKRLITRLMAEGVTFIDPCSCWLAQDVQIGADTVILPQVVLGPGVRIGEGCHIGPFCQISRSTIGNDCQVLAFCHLDGATLAGPNTIGPHARLRPGAVLDPHAKVGNFCEIKQSRIGSGSKINHLSYIGDALVGQRVNVGAGTITCNYDGVHKHQTVIEDGAFIGSGTQLVAPVRIGTGAYVGAGTTVTKEIPAGSLAVSRTPQHHYPNYAGRSSRKKE